MIENDFTYREAHGVSFMLFREKCSLWPDFSRPSRQSMPATIHQALGLSIIVSDGRMA